MSSRIIFDGSNLYRSVLNRNTTSYRAANQKIAASNMINALKNFVRNQNQINLQKFYEEEKYWLSIVGGRFVSYAEILITQFNRRNSIIFNNININSPHNSKYDPTFGYIYGMVSVQHPNLIKLGATSGRRHPQDRRSELLQKYKFQNLEISFFCEVTFPVKAEKEWTLRFGDRRARLRNGDSREWYFFSQFEACSETQKIVKDLNLKEYSKWYFSPEILKNDKFKVTIPERKAPNGTLSTLNLNK
jgi:hypothetical protein